MTQTTLERPAKVAMNGVDVPTLLGTIGVVAENRDLAKFQFRSGTEWTQGTHSRTAVNGYFGAGAEQSRAKDFVIDADHPAVLCGSDAAANPMEILLTALAACITAGIGNIASVRQITLTSIKVTVEGDVDLAGLLGLDETVRNGFHNIRARVAISGDAPDAGLARIVDQAIARSAVFDVLTSGTDVVVEAA